MPPKKQPKKAVSPQSLGWHQAEVLTFPGQSKPVLIIYQSSGVVPTEEDDTGCQQHRKQAAQLSISHDGEYAIATVLAVNGSSQQISELRKDTCDKWLIYGVAEGGFRISATSISKHWTDTRCMLAFPCRISCVICREDSRYLDAWQQVLNECPRCSRCS